MSPSETSPMAGLFGRRSTLPSIESVRSLLMPPVRAAAFWTAIAFPVVYVPILATGVVWEHPLALLSLFVLHMVAFVVGHDHNRPDGPERQV